MVTRRHAAMPRPRAPRRERAKFIIALAFVSLIASFVSNARAATTDALRGSRPGARPWIVERAELHGLRANALERASANVETIVDRDCFVVAKDGAIVHESYYGGASDANEKFQSDGVGTLALVAAVGVALAQRLFELDEPLGKFNLASVERAYGTYAHEVTVRQLLAQTHGGGARAPGTAFARDRDEDGFLDIIGELIEARSGVKLENWARAHVGERIGVPELFRDAERGASGSISLRRGTRASCRDAAKLAQVFVNKGKWLSEDGVVRQLFDPSFAVTAMSVSYPSLNQAHGLMTWLHVPTSKTGSKCCKPQATATSCGESAEAIDGPILGVNAPRSPVAIVVGNEGSMIYMLPETNTVVVTLGRTVAGTPACPVAPSDVVNKLGQGRRDDAFLVRTIWDAMSGALKPTNEDATNAPSRIGTSSAERDWHRWSNENDHADVDDKQSRAGKRGDDSVVARVGDDEAAKSSLLQSVREVVESVIGAEVAKRDGVVHDGHASYEDSSEREDDEVNSRRRDADDHEPHTKAEAAAEAYKARQIAYARDMQEREYKKYELKIQRDYQNAIKANQERYQEAMRAAQEEPDAVVRAKLEDEAAAEYMDGVNTIEQIGKDSLDHLASWRASTLPPKHAKAQLGADAADDEGIAAADAAKQLEIMQLAVEKNVDKMTKVTSRASRGTFARLGAAAPASLVRFSIGSCVCGCPNTRSTSSTCFDVDASALSSSDEAAQVCSAMHSRAALGCPHTGIVQKCGEVVGKRGTASGDLECRQVRRCPQTKEEEKSIEFLAAVFDCRPNKFEACAYVSEPCARSNVLVRPVIAPVEDSSAVRLSRADIDADREVAHGFSDHDHVLVQHNALVRWVHRASPELSIGIAVAVLALALVTIASKWPTTVTGGDPFASSNVNSITKRRPSAEAAPLLVNPRAMSREFSAKRTSVNAMALGARMKPPQRLSVDDDARDQHFVIAVDDDGSRKSEKAPPAMPREPVAPSRPVVIPQPQTFAFAERLNPTVEISGAPKLASYDENGSLVDEEE